MVILVMTMMMMVVEVVVEAGAMLLLFDGQGVRIVCIVCIKERGCTGCGRGWMDAQGGCEDGRITR